MNNHFIISTLLGLVITAVSFVGMWEHLRRRGDHLAICNPYVNKAMQVLHRESMWWYGTRVLSVELLAAASYTLSFHAYPESAPWLGVALWHVFQVIWLAYTILGMSIGESYRKASRVQLVNSLLSQPVEHRIHHVKDILRTRLDTVRLLYP